MVVLLIGGGSRFMDALIDKMKKNNHRVYLLTGDKNNRFSYNRVFEKYNFSYDTDNMEDIFRSINPELTVFMGAYDTNFNWQGARKEAVRYTVALMNLLSAHSMTGKGRFVYISSQEVYGGACGDNISEEKPAAAQGFKALAVAQGEELCENYRSARGTDAMTLRFDHVYGIPGEGQRQEDPCFRMCLEAVKTGKISANGRNSFSMIYLNDAVELGYQAMTAPEPSGACYHISSMAEINEMQLANLVQAAWGGNLSITDNSVGEPHRLLLDAGKFAAEFNWKIFTDYETGVRRVVKFMKRHKESFLVNADTGERMNFWHNIRIIFKKLVPFIENLICFIPFFMLNNRAVGSAYFGKLDFYLLYVLLFAVVHGQQQALLSALLAVAGYYFQQMHERSGFEVMLDYNTYVWMAQLFIVGMVTGYLKDRLHHIKSEAQEEIEYLRGKLDDIVEINDSNVRMKQSFEMQVVNQKDSLGKVYELTSRLEGYGPEEVLFYAAQAVSELMGSRDVAVYTVANGAYARLFSATSREARRLGNSIKYTDMESMYGELKEGRVFINKTMEEGLPLMAAAVYAEEEMRLILMVWGLPWQRMTLAEANRLTVIGRLIQNASVRASRYLEALRASRYVGETNVLDENAFTLLVKAFFEARAKGLTECTLLEIVETGEREMENTAAVLGSRMRQTDYMGMLEGGKLCVLLANTDEENARKVRERFREQGCESYIREAVAEE